MTNDELAELRGEIFALKIMLFNALAEGVRHSGDPEAYVNAIEQHASAGIMNATPSNIRPAYLDTFRNAAAGILAQAVAALRETYSRAVRPPTRQ